LIVNDFFLGIVMVDYQSFTSFFKYTGPDFAFDVTVFGDRTKPAAGLGSQFKRWYDL